MVLRLFELEVVPQKIRRLTRRGDAHRETGQPLAAVWRRKIEGEQCFRIAAVRDEPQCARDSDDFHASALPRSESWPSPTCGYLRAHGANPKADHSHSIVPGG